MKSVSWKKKQPWPAQTPTFPRIISQTWDFFLHFLFSQVYFLDIIIKFVYPLQVTVTSFCVFREVYQQRKQLYAPCNVSSSSFIINSERQERETFFQWISEQFSSTSIDQPATRLQGIETKDKKE